MKSPEQNPAKKDNHLGICWLIPYKSDSCYAEHETAKHVAFQHAARS